MITLNRSKISNSKNSLQSRWQETKKYFLEQIEPENKAFSSLVSDFGEKFKVS